LHVPHIEQHSEPGTEITLVWGEEGGGSSKPTVEAGRDGSAVREVEPPPARPYYEAREIDYRMVPNPEGNEKRWAFVMAERVSGTKPGNRVYENQLRERL
jgi:hypothetical protein